MATFGEQIEFVGKCQCYQQSVHMSILQPFRDDGVQSEGMARKRKRRMPRLALWPQSSSDRLTG